MKFLKFRFNCLNFFESECEIIFYRFVCRCSFFTTRDEISIKFAIYVKKISISGVELQPSAKRANTLAHLVSWMTFMCIFLVYDHCYCVSSSRAFFQWIPSTHRFWFNLHSSIALLIPSIQVFQSLLFSRCFSLLI